MNAGEAASSDPVAGARNMLLNCAGVRPGERLLLLHERSEHGVYGDGLVAAATAAADALGVSVGVMEVGLLEQPEAMPAEVARAMAGADHAVFFARLGDQLRFRPMPQAARPVVSYALDSAMLGSSFARADHHAMVALKKALDQALCHAGEIRVTCRLGTDISGTVDPTREEGSAQTTIRRFPLSVFTPLAAADFSGRVALARFLVGTGSHYYHPYGVPLDGVTSIDIAKGRIRGLSGSKTDMARIRTHYAHVAKLLGIDGGIVHSWHAGIHPGCSYRNPASANYERWSAGAFGNPRILHFHTCGDYAPGEICWNVIDPTISIDGVAVWEDGVLRPECVRGGSDILAQYPQVASLFASPAREIGL